jgi:hypothetical protein
MAHNAAAWARLVDSLYADCRPQLHTTLYVLLYSTLMIGMISLVQFVLSFFPYLSVKWNFTMLWALAGAASAGELVKGVMKEWLGVPQGSWSFVSIAAAGATSGFAHFAPISLSWGRLFTYEPLLAASFGALAYLLLGWLFFREERKTMQNGA